MAKDFNFFQINLHRACNQIRKEKLEKTIDIFIRISIFIYNRHVSRRFGNLYWARQTIAHLPKRLLFLERISTSIKRSSLGTPGVHADVMRYVLVPKTKNTKNY